MSTPRSPEPARRLLRLVALVMLALTIGAAAAESMDRSAERQRIARERAELQARMHEAERACARQFAVSACVERERGRHREQLRLLDRQRSVVDETERKQRAAESQDRIRARQLSRAAEGIERAASAGAPRATRLAAPPASPSRPPPDPRVRAEAQARAASAADVMAAQRAQAAARRAEQAAAHRESVERRNRERAASSKKAAAPLPVPAPASLPR